MATKTDLMHRFIPLVRDVFAGCLATLGVIHVIAGEQVARLFQGWPEGLPGRPYWAHAGGVLLVALGVMSLLRFRAWAAMALIGFLVLVSVFALHLPRALPTDNLGDEWSNFLKWLAMAAGCFVVAETWSANRAGSFLDGAIAVIAPLTRWCLAAFMISAAILHVRFADGLAQFYIPTYLPWPLFWTYATAGTLAAGGIGLMIPATTGLAGRLSGLMIFLWCPLVHVPRTFAEPGNPAEWCGVFESLAFAAIALLVAMRPRPE